MNIGNFDIADITMVSPSHGATVPIPFTFQWNRRSWTSDNYRFYLFDPTGLLPPYYLPNLGNVGSVTVTGLPPGYTAGPTYGWYLAITATDGSYGMAHYYRAVSFSNAGPSFGDNSIPQWSPSPDEAIPPIHRMP